MNGLSRGEFPGLAKLKEVEALNEYLRGPAVQLEPDLAADVEPIVLHSGTFTRDPDRRKNWGEVATVLTAARRGAPVIIDDRDGRTLARRRGVPRYGTRALVVQMLADGALTEDDAFAVWRASGSRHQAREDFNAAVLRQRN